ncbi:hypothetical protein QO009_001641 [Brevibacillus aydinogluensis]|uniref:50S ribosomal protein L22 n=1 Tax=Brevibacillus aydinogluensis TaxID=927786 RepID=A0AA48RBB4_9BACL|nr:hypothetical protein [Brevibacillus aydinogluensis]MDT3415775.1 hypothetical protein [Brevibacillus aydinogluensis]CAJ1001340.1 50S ribosomal protein L22 [Brevibacillus aydinogluensis]
MKKPFGFAASAVIVAAVGITSAAAAQLTASPPDPGQERTAVYAAEVQRLAESCTFVDNGLNVQALDEAAKVDENTALAAAKRFIGSSRAATAEKVTMALARLTDAHGQGVPVWIVTFHGVEMPRNGKPGRNQYVNADVHVMIDANTGEAIEMIAGKRGQ